MLSKKLFELRKKYDYTHDFVANYLNITRQAYSFYESGKREMSYESLCMLADLYNVTTDFLLGRVDEVNSAFNDDEKNIVNIYRNLDERGKDNINNLLKYEAARKINKYNNIL